MNYKALELKLCQIVERRLRQGWVVKRGLIAGGVHAHYTECCAVGSVAIEGGHFHAANYVDAAARFLGVDYEEMVQLEGGFEGWDFTHNESHPMFKIGRRIRERYVEFK